MPKRSVWLIRLALVYLVLGFSLGALLLVHKATPLHSSLWRLRTAHVDVLLFGFMVQLAFGVATWILPRTRPRQPTALVWWALALLNAGVGLVALDTTVLQTGSLLLLGRLAEIAAAGMFAIHVWPRIRSFRHE